MKFKPLLTALLIIPLISCSQDSSLESKVFCFDTAIDIRLFEGEKNNLKDIENIFNYYDKITDNYKERDTNNVYSINHTNEDVKVDETLYSVLQKSFALKEDVCYFNPLCGSLVKKWKESLKSSQILDETTISNELTKMNNSSVLFKENSVVQRLGEAEIDLGAVAKGFALDEVKSYLGSKSYSKYLISSGYSSILLGQKSSDDGLFSVGLSDIENAYLKLSNCFVSTSGVSTQGVKIDDQMYSHIVNPYTGSAINNYDTVIVVSDSGYLGDALSTSFMLSSVDEIKAVEQSKNVKALVIKDKTIIYKNESLEVYYH